MIDGLLKKAFGGLVRHALGYVSGILLGLGIAKEVVAPFADSAEQLLISAIGIGVAYLLSFVNSKKMLKLLGQ